MKMQVGIHCFEQILLNQLCKGLALRTWPILLTRSLRVQTGNILIFLNAFSRHRTYGKLSWSLEVKRATSLNQTHINRLVTGVCFLTITEASHRAAQHKYDQTFYKILVQRWKVGIQSNASQSLATDSTRGLESIDMMK